MNLVTTPLLCIIFELFSSEDISNWTNDDLVNFVDDMQGADDSFKQFFSTADASGDFMSNTSNI